MTKSQAPRGHPFVSVLDTNNVRINLAAGGSKGPEHLGFLERIDLEDFNIVEVAGTSVGSIVAAFYTNGYKPRDIIPMFLEGLSNRNNPKDFVKLLPAPMAWMLGGWMNPVQFFKDLDLTSPSGLTRYLSMFDPLSFMLGGVLDLRSAMRDMCQRYNLKPNDRLTIYACDILRHKSVKYSGTDYDLAEALTASCALPGVFRPVWHNGADGAELLVDGAMYHYSPPDDFDEPAIFSVFEPATEMPTKGSPAELYLASREVYHFPIAGNQRHVDKKKHIVVTTKPKWPGLFMALDAKDVLEMVQDGFDTTDASLAAAYAQGRIPARTK